MSPQQSQPPLTEDFDPVLYSPYNYIPSQNVAITMIVLFALSSSIHSGQAIYYKTWWLFPTAVLCGVLEVLGWSGRLWSHSEVWLWTPFQIQICCTIIAPTPLLAASFVIFGRVIRRLGTVYSRLTPKLYMIVFCTCDAVSLVVQGIGGGLAATADESNGRDPDDGGNIMLGGIAFQLFVITLFACCAVEYIVRYLKDKPIHTIEGEDAQHTLRGEMTTKLKIVLAALTFSTLVLFIRGVYRTIELVDGWTGRIIATEVYFNVLDGAMIVLAIYTLNFVHPGCFLSETSASASASSSDEKPV